MGQCWRCVAQQIQAFLSESNIDHSRSPIFYAFLTPLGASPGLTASICPHLHIMLFLYWFCCGLFSLSLGQDTSSSCLHSTLISFTSSSTSLACPQALAASSSRRSTSLPGAVSALRPWLWPRASHSSSWVLPSFKEMSSCSWQMECAGAEAEQRGIDLLVSECERISSMEAQRFLSVVWNFFPVLGVCAWLSHQVQELSLLRGKLWDLTVASQSGRSLQASVLEFAVFFWSCASGVGVSSSWMRSSVSIPSDVDVEAWPR